MAKMVLSAARVRARQPVSSPAARARAAIRAKTRRDTLEHLPVHGGGVVFAHVVRHHQHLHLHGALAEAQLQLPPLTAVPGIKLGLANVVTVYAMFTLGPGDALLILCARVFLGAVFSGQMMTLLYSAAGGFLSWCVLLLLRRLLTRRQIWLCSPVAGVFHNLGQLLAAAGVMKTWAVLAYLPYLVPAGILAGLFTGLCAQFLLDRLGKLER